MPRSSAIRISAFLLSRVVALALTPFFDWMNPYDVVRAAGKRHQGHDETTEYCLRDPPSRPVHPKTQQFSTTATLGQRLLHPGIRADPTPVPRSGAFGKVSGNSGESSKALMDASLPPMAAMIVRKAEELTYLSVTRLPLGKGYVHGGHIDHPPAATLKPDFRYGNPGASLTETAKDFIQGQGPSDPEAEEIAERVYEKSHRAFPPGVQRRGGVDWNVAQVNPQEQVFGMPAASLERNAVEKCLNPLAEGGPPENALTAIIPKITDDFRVSAGGQEI